jgi:hypothetical protein
MNSYRVTYFLNGEEFVVVIQAENTGDVFGILEEQEPDAVDIKIERIND